MARVVVRPQADRDIEEQCLYFSSQGSDLALRFFDAVHRTITQLADSPDLGIRYNFHDPRLHDIRWWKVRRFRNHLIFYRPVERAIEIIRILHASRDIPVQFDDA